MRRRNARTWIGKEQSEPNWFRMRFDCTQRGKQVSIGACGKLRFREGGDALQRSLHLGMVAVERRVIGVGRDEDVFRHAHIGARKRLWE